MHRWCNLVKWSPLCLLVVTNPIDVIKIRMQLENELAVHEGLGAIKNRYYDGFVKGGAMIVRDEGMRGLYKGYE